MTGSRSHPAPPLRSIRRTALGVLLAGAAALGPAALPGSAHAAASTAFTAGDLVVYRVGDGSTSLSGSSAPVFLDEYAPGGTLVESVPLPTTASDTGNAFTDAGTANSDGELTLSANGQYLLAAGYDSPVGTAGVTSTDAVTVARAAADGTVDTSTALPSFAAGNNVRSAVSSNGTDIWVAGAAGGIAHTTLGATTATTLNSSDLNFRQLEIADGQLYASSNKNSLTVAAVGTGLPTTAGQSIDNLPGNPDSGGDPYSYALFTLGSGSAPDTLYIADATAGKILKYGLSSGKWKAEGSEKVSSVTGLTGTLHGSTVQLYATGSGSSGASGTLSSVTDTSGAGGSMSGSVTTLASAASRTAFRGVAFAPGTAVVTAVSPPPTISTPQAGLPAALGDSTNAAMPVTVGDAAYGAAGVTVTAASSDTAVAPASGISVTGSGATRTLTVTPAAVGYSTLTLTATAPDGTSASTTVDYGVSAAVAADPNARYYSGAGNGSTIIDVGGGYMLVGDDESNVLRLYQEGVSGPPVKTFDFTGLLPYGSTEIDIEAAARVGNRIYWTGSMSNSSSGKLEPARSTLFATDITGSGASTTLSYVGSYTGLRSDLIAWDQDNGHGLGANALGFAASAASGVGGHTAESFNVEGLEFAPGSTTTAYLAFRGPLESTSTRNQALLVPVTNLDQLVTGGNPGTLHAAFGAPIEDNLGGLGFREIRKNADDQYLIIAGAADETDSFALYSWDGRPGDAPVATHTALPAGAADGSWESIGAVPDPLTSGSTVSVLQDNGDTVWYGDGLDSKDGIPADLQKDLGDSVTYTP
ncbi:hypothetical protein GXW83_10745 [Streptacidiphilus sp. PB12-B1b]|uniref:hypothetical protein n=1 Tax=Streptacidiphilus sp. PB12-B1b TaxID=2705012 RepID=UPI0015F91C60|nr:hypothetical protein [Streptacidiphilus sp. PB12-B1b]QMU76143.1 hypothetical protein GXW83_10745 [Streptacidiphilus sp. PB12-B1b]